MAANKEYYEEFSRHLIEDEKPSAYFLKKEEEGIFKERYPLTLLGKLKDTKQSPVHHPEGNVWIHTMQVIDNAALLRDQSDEPEVFMWAALLHDIGKPSTTRVRRGKITAYDHDLAGEKLSWDFLHEFALEESFIIKVSKMVRWHMQVLMVIKDLPYANIKKMVREVPPYEIALLAMCDRLGRGGFSAEILENEKNNIKRFLEKCIPYIK